jgi:hypothetical protein
MSGSMRSSWRLLWLAVLATLVLVAAPLTLHLKSGGEMLVREYEVNGERVRYYSSERSQWEEMPTRLIDLEKTQQVVERQNRRLEAMRAESAAERRAERKGRTELHNIPIDDGLYLYQGEQATAVPQDEVIEEQSGKRNFLRVLSPVPLVPGKRKLLVEGKFSNFLIADAVPIFFIRDPQLVHFAVIKLTEDKRRRLAQIIEVAQDQQFFEQQEEVQVFRQQLASGVYRVWPTQDLPPGEYAFINFTPGELDLRVWSFAVQLSTER